MISDSSKGKKGFHTRGNGFFGRGMNVEGKFSRECVKPRGRSENEWKWCPHKA